MTIAGLTADAKSISRWMRTECLSSRFYHNSALRLETLMCDLGNKMQNCIQLYNRRPYGVGLIVAGCDDLGPHIYQVRYSSGVQNKRDDHSFSYKIPIVVRVENYQNVMQNPSIFSQMLLLMWEASQWVLVQKIFSGSWVTSLQI